VGSIPAHRDDPSRLQAVGSIPASLLCQGRALVAVETAWPPFGIFPPLLRVDPTPRGWARQSHLLGWSEDARPTLEGSGEAERPPRGSDEPGTSSVGPDWAVAALIIILGGPRLMSFDSYLMGTVLLVPDTLAVRNG
jgi:hypothetical protein